jgi:hypothetical protein
MTEKQKKVCRMAETYSIPHDEPVQNSDNGGLE